MATWGESTFSSLTSASALSGYLYFSGGQIAESGTLESVTINLRASSGTTDAYIGIYKNSTDDAANATLIADTGNLTGNYGTAGTETFTLVNGTKTFAAGDYLYVAVMVASGGSTANFDWNICEDFGDFASLSGLTVYNYRSSGSLSALPSTIGASSSYSGSAVAAYVTYTAGGGSIVPQAMANYINQVIQ